jgi:hypothetical protein
MAVEHVNPVRAGESRQAAHEPGVSPARAIRIERRDGDLDEGVERGLEALALAAWERADGRKYEAHLRGIVKCSNVWKVLTELVAP